MKKYLLTLFIITLVAAMSVGCGGTGSADKETKEPQSSSEQADAADAELGDLLSNTYVDIMKGDKYTMSYKAVTEVEGQSMEVETTVAVSGEDTAMTNKAEGFESTTIIKEGFVYMVDHTGKTVMKWAQSQEDETGALSTDEMKYLGSGTEDGLVYEEYATADGSVKYYFDGKDLKKIASTTEGVTVVMEDIKISKDVNSSLFEIPAGYQEITM